MTWLIPAAWVRRIWCWASYHMDAGQSIPLTLTSDGLDALASAVSCPRCTDGGTGTCICTINCGHDGCTYDHTFTLTAADMRMLHKWIREGHK